MSFNPYVTQVARQSGMSEAEVRRSATRRPVTLEYAQAQGFSSVDEYLEALHEFLNGN